MERKIRFEVMRRSGKAGMKLALLGIIVVSTVALIALYGRISVKEANNEALKRQAAQLERENQKLEQYNENKNTDEGVRDVAREEQGMADPDTVIYDFE